MAARRSAPPASAVGLGLDQTLERPLQIRLTEHLAHAGARVVLVIPMSEIDVHRRGPLADLVERSSDPPHGVPPRSDTRPAISMAGASTSARLIVPHSASIVINPPGVPGVTAARGPNSGG